MTTPASRLAKAALAGLLGLVILAVIAVSLAWWWAGREGALEWLANRAEVAAGGKLRLEGAHGSLRSEVHLDRAAYADGPMQVEASDVAIKLDWYQLLRLSVGIESLSAARIQVRLPPPDGAPPQLPPPMALPVPVRIQRAEIGSVLIEREGERYQVNGLSFAYSGGPLSHYIGGLKASLRAQDREARIALTGTLGAASPFSLDAELGVQLAQPAIGVQSRWSGSLERTRVRARSEIAQSRLDIDATLAPFAERRVLSARVDAAAVDIARLVPFFTGAAADLPHTELSLSLEAEETPAHRFTGALEAANARAGPYDRGLVPLTSLAARFDTDFTETRLSGLNAAFGAGGALAGEATVQDTTADLKLDARAIDLRSFYSTLRQTALTGPLTLELRGERQAAQASLTQADISVSFDVVRAGSRIDVRSFRAVAFGGEASGSATAQIGKPTTFSASLALARFDPSQLGDYPAGLLNGTADVQGALAAGNSARRVAASWNVNNSTLFGQPLVSSGRATITGEEASMRVTGAEVSVALGTVRLQATGGFGTPADQLAWKLDAPRLDQLPETPWTRTATAGLAGNAHVEGTVRGGFGQWQLGFTGRGAQLATPGSVTVSSVELKGSLGNTQAAPFDVTVDARRVNAPGVQFDRVRVGSAGTLAQHDIRLALGNELLDLDARLQGALQLGNDPGWSGRIVTLTNRGSYPLELAAPTPLEASARQVRLGRLEARLGDGRLLVRQALWQRGDGNAEGKLSSSGEFAALPAAWILIPAGLGGEASPVRSTLQLSGDWSIETTPALNGRVTVRRSAGDVFIEAAGTELGMQAASIEALFREGTVTAVASLDSRLATLRARGESSPTPGAPGIGFTPGSPLSFEARAEVTDVRPLLASLQTQGRVSGKAAAVLRGSGTLGKPLLEGSVTADGLGYELPPYGLYLRDGVLRAELHGDRLDVSELTVKAGDGRFTASGPLPLRFADGGAKLAWRAENFGVLNRPDMRLAFDGNGNVGFDGSRIFLQGSVTAQRGDFELRQNRLPTLGDDVVIVKPGEPVEPPRAKGKLRLPIDLDLQADLGERFRLNAYGFEGRLTGRVRFTTDVAGELRAEGTINSVNATFQAYGQRLEVAEGTVIFNGPIDNPTLQVRAWRRNMPVQVGVQVNGTVQDPRVQLVSEPPVTEGEKLSWLVLGHAPNEATGGDAAMLQAAAGALFGRGNSPSPTQRIAKTFGLDEITLRSSSTLPSQVVAVGKRLSDRVYISYEQAVSVVYGSLVRLDYSLTRRLSLRAETGTTSGVGVVYRYSWD